MMEFIGDTTTWKDLFKRQTDSGKFWVNLHKHGNFDTEKFLMKSDAYHICYKAQSDVLKKLAKRLKKENKDLPDWVIDEIKKLENELWQGPDSVNE